MLPAFPFLQPVLEIDGLLTREEPRVIEFRRWERIGPACRPASGNQGDKQVNSSVQEADVCKVGGLTRAHMLFAFIRDRQFLSVLIKGRRIKRSHGLRFTKSFRFPVLS
jgi:hypothetical protein